MYNVLYLDISWIINCLLNRVVCSKSSHGKHFQHINFYFSMALFYLGFSDFEILKLGFCGFLQHCDLRFLVFTTGGLRFPDVVHGFSVALIIIISCV